jgi:hypothetical protein
MASEVGGWNPPKSSASLGLSGDKFLAQVCGENPDSRRVISNVADRLNGAS